MSNPRRLGADSISFLVLKEAPDGGHKTSRDGAVKLATVFPTNEMVALPVLKVSA
jgi:hypothetical protein